jgi:hypothetical protein
MFKKLLIALVIILTAFIIPVLFDDSTPSVVPPEIELGEVGPLPHFKNPTIETLNLKNASIDSFVSTDVKIKIWQDGRRLKLSGFISYQKPDGFRMTISSILGKEMDLGSNDKVFWYWSRRDSRPSLYWATYEDYSKTRLKDPFNPLFMRATLGFEQLTSLEKVFITEDNNRIVVTYDQKNSMGDPILYHVFVDKVKQRITGFQINKDTGESIATCQIRQWANDLPSEIVYSWHEEKVTMLIQLNNPSVNLKLNKKSFFKLPDINPKINMG